MRRSPSIIFILCLLVSLFLLHPISEAERPIPQPKGLVNDFADVIPPDDEEKINIVTSELLNKTQIPVVVVTMPDIGGAEYNDYANRLYSTWGIGKKGEDKGVLIFITIKERKMRIETGYGVEGILPDGLVGEIRDRYMVPYLKNDRFGQGLLNGTVAVAQIIAKDAGVTLSGQVPLKRPDTGSKNWIVFFPLILIFLFLLFSSRRRGSSWLFFLPILMGGGRGYRRGYGSGGFGGSFVGFGGGFGGFGGGSSGGVGAGGSF